MSVSLKWRWLSDTLPTSVVLADPTGAFGIRREDNGVEVVPVEAPMNYAGDGLYSFDFEDAVGATSYEAYIKVTDGDDVYWIHKYIKSRLGADPSTDSIDCAANVVLSVLIELGLATDYALYDPKDTTTKRDWPGIVGGMQSDPDEMLALYDSGGIIDGIVQMGEGPVIIEHPDVQIRVRAKKGAYMTAKRTARKIKDKLIRTRNYDVSVSNELVGEPPEMYRLSAVTPQGKELYAGSDDRGRPAFTVNVRTSIKKLRT